MKKYEIHIYEIECMKPVIHTESTLLSITLYTSNKKSNGNEYIVNDIERWWYNGGFLVNSLTIKKC